MPLNRLAPKPQKYPKEKDVTALISKLRYDEVFDAAFQQVFSKTIICSDLNRGSGLAKEYELDAITLHGDRAERKGALTGGYHDARRSRLEAVKHHKSIRAQLASEDGRALETKKQLEKVDSDANAIQNAMAELETRRRRVHAMRDTIKSDVIATSRELSTLQDHLAMKEKSLKSLRESVCTAQAQLEALRDEMTTDMRAGLTTKESQELTVCVTGLEKTQAELTDVSQHRAKAEMKKTALENELNANLVRRRDEIQLRLDRLDGSGEDMGRAGQSVDQVKDQLKQVIATLKSVDAKLAGLSMVLVVCVMDRNYKGDGRAGD
jgi:structural maintenance of chromosome 3 (chondroitin sulfate proteoglycan 6)